VINYSDKMVFLQYTINLNPSSIFPGKGKGGKGSGKGSSLAL